VTNSIEGTWKGKTSPIICVCNGETMMMVMAKGRRRWILEYVI